MAQTPRKKGTPAGRRRAPARPGPKGKAPPAPPAGPWATATIAVVLAVLLLRLGVNALEPFPVHFDEAQYWAYGQELGWGYYSKPPLVAWIVRIATDIGGDTLFTLRLASPLAHAAIGWLIFLTGRRLWDGQVGFWAAAGYTAAPGVGLSAMIMSTDPVLMVFWAAALYALVRAAEAEGAIRSRIWWVTLGALIGAGMLAKYTMIAFGLGALGYLLFSADSRDWKRGAEAVASVAVIAGVVMLPNIIWNIDHAFVTLNHVLGDADPGKGYFHPLELAKFAGAQFAVIGPIFLVAIYLALQNATAWREDWGMRLVAWQTVAMLVAICGLALATRAQANWAAPAYIGGSLLAARWLVVAGGLRALRAQLGVGIAASLALWISAGLYAGQAEALTRRLDPYLQMRISEPFCQLVLGTMGDEGLGVLLSDNRRRLSECMYYGGLGWDEVAIWNPDGRPDNHHELVASLQPGDDREMLLVAHQGAERIAHHFHEAREVESGRLATHIDRDVGFEVWVVQGFKGY